MAIQGSYRLSSSQVERALGMLEREEGNHPVGPLEQASYVLLQVFIFGYLLSGTAFLIVRFLPQLPVPGASTVLPPMLLRLFLAFSLLAVLWCIVNLVYAQRFRRRLRLLSRFGVLQVLDDPWRAEQRRRGFGRFWSALLLLGGLFGSGVSMLLLVLWIVFSLIEEGLSKTEFLWGISVSSVLLMTSLILIGQYFLRRARLRRRLVAEAGRLRRLLESELAQGDGGVALEPEVHRELAAIERAQIRRSRAEAIQKSLTRQGLPGYAILKSQRVTEQQANLEPESILAVEYAIQGLAFDPRPELAKTADDSRLLALPVANSRSKLVYEVDDQAHRVLVHRLVASWDPASPERHEESRLA